MDGKRAAVVALSIRLENRRGGGDCAVPAAILSSKYGKRLKRVISQWTTWGVDPRDGRCSVWTYKTERGAEEAVDAACPGATAKNRYVFTNSQVTIDTLEWDNLPLKYQNHGIAVYGSGLQKVDKTDEKGAALAFSRSAPLHFYCETEYQMAEFTKNLRALINAVDENGKCALWDGKYIFSFLNCNFFHNFFLSLCDAGVDNRSRRRTAQRYCLRRVGVAQGNGIERRR